MSHPSQSNSFGNRGGGGGNKSHYIQSTPLTFQQSMSSYHQHPPPPPPPQSSSSSYYYQHNNTSSTMNDKTPYPPPRHQQQQSPYSFHTQHGYHRSQHINHHPNGSQQAACTPWPAPPTTPPSNNDRIMDDDDARSPSPSLATIADAASTLSTLARTASFQDPSTSSSSSSPLDNNSDADGRNSSSPEPEADDDLALSTRMSTSPSSSAGPLKKRRKVDNDNNNATNSNNNEKSSMSNQFPIMLHELLSKGKTAKKKKDDGKSTEEVDSNENDHIVLAMEWVNHGKSFRILRYDVLCTQVLPKEFGTSLCHAIFPMKEKKNKIEETKKEVQRSSGNDDSIHKSESRDDDDKNNNNVMEEGRDVERGVSEYTDDEWIEAFTWHIKSFGFEEIMVGRDKGSFRHELFVRESPDLCNKMKMTHHRTQYHRQHSNNYNSTTQLTPIFSSIKMIGTSPQGIEPSPPAWRSGITSSSKRGGISSIFKPRRHTTNVHHPSHLHVPMLSSTNTASFADTWLNEGTTYNANHRQYHNPRHHQQHQHSQHVPPPYPPPTRSPRTIRFSDETNESFDTSSPGSFYHKSRDDAVEITPNSEVSPSPHPSGRKQLVAGGTGSSSGEGGGGYRPGFVSKRGRRPPMISRHSTH